MQSGGGPLQPGPPVMRGLSSGTSTPAQHQQQQQQVDKLYRNPNASCGSIEPIDPPDVAESNAVPIYRAAPFFARIPAAVQFMANYDSIPSMASGYPSQYYIQSAPILAQVQLLQMRRNPTGDNSPVNINSQNPPNGPSNSLSTSIPQMQQVPLPQLQPPNQQLSPMSPNQNCKTKYAEGGLHHHGQRSR